MTIRKILPRVLLVSLTLAGALTATLPAAQAKPGHHVRICLPLQQLKHCIRV